MSSNAAYPTRTLGSSGLVVSAIGLGAMGMSQSYGPTDDAESIATIHRALDLGVTFLDTAGVYGGGENEKLVGRALQGRRDEVVLASKFGIIHGANGFRGVDGRPESITQNIDVSLGRLGVDHIDLFYQHRVDPDVPIEESVGALAKAVAEGKIGHIGLSEVSVDSLERAVAVHPIAALQSEWSLWARDLEAEVLPAARRLGIGIVPYSPLGRGFLTGAVRDRAELTDGDRRLAHPRFGPDTIDHNLSQFEQIDAIAADLEITPAQLALAWLLAQGDDIVPIPGTKRRTYLEQNAAAAQVELTTDVLDRIDAVLAAADWEGARQPADIPQGYGTTRRPGAEAEGVR